MPGNHDRYSDLLGRAGSKNFETDGAFKGLWSDDPVKSIVVERDGATLALVGTDFCLRQDSDAGPVVIYNRFGRGRAYPDVINRTIGEIKTIKSEYNPDAIVWMMHFPPIDSARSGLRLIDFSRAQSVADELDVSVILAGHLHRNEIYETKGKVPILAAGTATAEPAEDDKNNWIHRIEIDVSGGRLTSCKKTDYVWDSDRNNFRDNDPTDIPLRP